MLVDLYKILGVARDATQDEIKKAYREKAKLAHTDKKGGTGSEDEMTMLNRAYAVLKNPVRRKHYDETGEEKNIAFEQKFQELIGSIFLSLIDNVDVDKNDLVYIFQQNIQGIWEKKKELILAYDKTIVKLEKVQKRILIKKGENLIADMVGRRLFSLREDRQRLEREIEFFAKAIEHAKHYSYKLDSTDENYWQNYFLEA